MSFASLKKNRTAFADQIKTATVKDTEPKYASKEADTRFYYPAVDDNGNGMAIIRFLPPKEGESIPFAKVFNHGFKNKANGKWFIEDCPTTVGKDCPTCTENQSLWNTGLESDKQIARDRKRKTSYFLNVLVVKDSKNPENEGTVRLFRCGTIIFDKIKAAQNPEFEDEQSINPFDMWEGANFKLKIRKVDGQTNYDTSMFETPTPISKDDKELEKIYNQIHSLADFTAPEKFKSYEELDSKLKKVLGATASTSRRAEEMDDEPAEEVKPKAQKSEKPKVQPKVEVDEEDDPDLAMFRELANS